MKIFIVNKNEVVVRHNRQTNSGKKQLELYLVFKIVKAMTVGATI